ncbi:DNA replication protein psf1 [Orbilia brochopaga]|uniref:DNA replication complex GINS protein PSF1 n=1 Tax=Orbilia brochopaga TaxID=3140254 RepID=A0AAV9UNS3_9PEZI
MYGELGNKLVIHAKRTQALNLLPAYQTDIVRAVTREVRDLNQDIHEITNSYQGDFNPSADPAAACALLVHHLCVRRNKRCLLAYHRVRAEKIEHMCWNGMDAMEQVQAGRVGMEGEEDASAAAGTPAHALSPEEDEYARQYGDMLAAYKGHWTDIDLTGSLEPPKDLFIDVRVLKDAGEIQTEYGAITLSKNSQFFVRQGDVERLIKQGFLQKLS